MKDYTDKFYGGSGDTGSRHLYGDKNGFFTTFILYESGQNKLALVKAIKSFGGLGLKESKDFMDDCKNHPVKFSKLAINEDIIEFKRQLDDLVGVSYEIVNFSKTRDKKLIQLGLCDKSEVIDYLVETTVAELYTSSKIGIDKLKETLAELYSEISEDNLIKIFNKNESRL